MARADASVVLYAVDLDELRDWIGCADQARFIEAWQAIRSDEDAEWEPEELAVLERLLRRVVFEGQLYDGLAPDERYYLTQLLIDLFDEYVDQDPLSEDIPVDELLRTLDSLPRDGEAARGVRWLARGRELDGEEVIWKDGPVEDVLSYFGYVTRDEAPLLAEALGAVPRRPGRGPGGLTKQLKSAADECARAELDLLSFVG